MYIITARRITSGELLKYRKGFCIAGRYGSCLPGSSQFSLTLPSKQFGVPINAVPHDYGEYLHFIRRRGAIIYYNSTMALLHEIRPSDIDDALEPISLKEMLDVLTANGDYLVY